MQFATPVRALAVLAIGGCAAGCVPPEVGPSSTSSLRTEQALPQSGWLVTHEQSPQSGRLVAPGESTGLGRESKGSSNNSLSELLTDDLPWARWNAERADPYELDGVERFLETTEPRLKCSPDGLIRYKGRWLKYQTAVTVNAAFRDRLERFEQVATDVAKEIYGRPPSKVVHLGAYSCRPSRSRNYRLSEHALGNAIDIAGFDFGSSPKELTGTPRLPKPLRYAFQVRVAKHWNKSGTPSIEAHARFLKLLTERLAERPDVFRGMIGPSRPGHHDHFHFDVAPWRYTWL